MPRLGPACRSRPVRRERAKNWSLSTELHTVQYAGLKIPCDSVLFGSLLQTPKKTHIIRRIGHVSVSARDKRRGRVLGVNGSTENEPERASWG